VIVVPSKKLAYFLRNDVVTYADAVKDIHRACISHFPLVVLALEHDGPEPALTKRWTRQEKKPTV
jgi:hypothetical protein